MTAELTHQSRIQLLIDAGNSNLKWSWLDGAGMGPVFRTCHRTQSLAAIAEIHWQDHRPPAAVLVSNVAGAALGQALTNWCQGQWEITPNLLRSPAEALGLRNGYDHPERLGIDRWLAMLAAFRERGGPLCVVDLGTAITIDLVDRQGHHLGGTILPGLETMRRALLDTTRIPPPEPADHAPLLCTDTADAVNGGGVQAAAALVERMLHAAAPRLGGAPQLILSGSDAPRLAAVLPRPSRIEADLVLHGLRLMTQPPASPEESTR